MKLEKPQIAATLAGTVLLVTAALVATDRALQAATDPAAAAKSGAATAEAAAGEAKVDEGKSLYEKKCAMCHGKDGVAKEMAKGSANFNDPEWRKTSSAEAISKVTAEGKGKMPGYKDKLTPEQIDAISRHILTMK
jgi:cytochrome c6